MSKHQGLIAALALLALLAWAGPALAHGEPTLGEPLVVAQADPDVDGSIGVRSERRGEEGVDADVRIQFGEEQAPPVSAGSDSGIDVIWVALGVGAVVIVLLIALLTRGGGSGTTVVRE